MTKNEKKSIYKDNSIPEDNIKIQKKSQTKRKKTHTHTHTHTHHNTCISLFGVPISVLKLRKRNFYHDNICDFYLHIVFLNVLFAELMHENNKKEAWIL